MVETFGGIIGGVGLLFFGMWLLSESLKTVAGPRIRMLAGRLTSNRFAAFGCGMVAGTITQSSVAVTSITVSMLRSDLISARQGFLVVLGANLGVASLILVVAFDIKFLALYVLGVAGVSIFRSRKVRYREIGVMLFGLASLVMGLIMIKEAAAPLVEQSWFQGALQVSTRSLLLSLALGAILTLILQAGLPVLAFGIVMAVAGLVDFDQILMFASGVYIGLGLAILAVALNLSSTARQIAMFSACQMFFPAAILVPLLYVELYLDVPLVKAAILSFDIGLASQIALVVILYGTPSRLVVLDAPDGRSGYFRASGQPARQSSCPGPSTFTTRPSVMSKRRLISRNLSKSGCWPCFRTISTWQGEGETPGEFVSRQEVSMPGSANSLPSLNGVTPARALSAATQC